MNPEALIGMRLGTCTLQRLIGQGGMGAVFLAQQSRPRRQVAVKVLFPMASLTPHQLAAFLERFRRETDAAASLEHPNIMPVYEYGEQHGLAYLVMPYISGGTLRDEMEREGAMALPKVLNYLEQLAAALDFAHERGVIHRDVKPANILKTPEGRLLLTDFGLVKIISEERANQVRLTGPGAPVGTPDYMSPEQVLGQPVDGRADLYSLGVILYQMVTGVAPFRGEAPMQIAAQHLQTPPTSPRVFRPDLPVAAEQVILRALAKNPADRYFTGQEMALAFRLALTSAGISVDTGQNPAIAALGLSGKFAVPGNAGGLFDPRWTKASAPQPVLDAAAMPQAPAAEAASQMQTRVAGEQPIPSFPAPSLKLPTAEPALPTAKLPVTNSSSRRGGLLSRTGMFPRVGTGVMPETVAGQVGPVTNEQPAVLWQAEERQPHNFTDPLPSLAAAVPSSGLAGEREQQSADAQSGQQLSSARSATTGALAPVAQQTATSPLVKLTGPVKVVKVPVAGQPGRYVTGLLPLTAASTGQAKSASRGERRRARMVVTLIVAALILVVGSGLLLWGHLHSAQKTEPQVTATPGLQTTASPMATAAGASDVLFSDPLSQNIHDWPTTPADTYAFKDGAYHITNHSQKGIAVVLQSAPFTGPIGYSLTMQEVKGDDTNVNNSFGLILRFSQQTRSGKTVTTFYSFEVQNIKGGEYRFYKYDDSRGPNNAWGTPIWRKKFGSEFHQGQGPKNVNTLKVFANGSSFTFIVNGKVVGQTKDSSLPSGTVGMLVNLNGTEVAFKDLLITRN
ncbi:serine/threonine protein kinase [Thermogemmatispora sp.]|uniref:serine/threonine protein kinase n=1 Tax=Thermogemmatispora sp. TaxID=1968838 RepID=UPI001DCA8EC7|nr:serine/threonine-protein kinase [Thermogemmatispora sp.]MBX5451787.1 protein kinase [Thermogemmatispora sp.]